MDNMQSTNKSYHWAIRKMQSVGNNAVLALISLTLLLAIETDANNIGANKLTHTSWTINKTRFDFIFNPEESISNVVRLDSDATNYLSRSLGLCANHSACLLQDGKFLQAFQVDNKEPHKSFFVSIDGKADVSKEKNETIAKAPFDRCSQHTFIVTHYCSTNWNPPAYQYKSNCAHSIDWHSPLRCHLDATSYERPCYVYEESGKLIDLTPWILSNGSSYQVDIGVNNSAIKKFSLNVCNEASSVCGPNVSSCLLDEKHGQIESGYNNLTSIKYDSKIKTVLLTQLGQFNQQCEDSRVKTIVHFICKNQVIAKSKPKLIRSSACENVIEWQTIHACPVAEIKVPAITCKIPYEPLKIDIDLKQLAHNSDTIEVPEFTLNGTSKKMIFGVCRGISRTTKCGGKDSAATSACLVHSTNESLPLTANNSEVVGSIIKSSIRFSDDRIYLESTVNKSCTMESSEHNLKITKQIGTRIEFYCSQESQDKPVFLGFDDCTYIFEWGSPLVCFETIPNLSQAKTSSPSESHPEVGKKEVKKADAMSTSAPKTEPRNPKTKLEETPKTGQQMHTETLKIAHEFSKVTSQQETKDKKDGVQSDSSPKIIQQQAPKLASAHMVPNKPQSKVDNWYKFFMISVILMSLVSFVVVIFILDKKTRLRVPLSSIRRQARQAFQPKPVPYSRVDGFNDCLDL